jgi:hypothetical protein
VWAVGGGVNEKNNMESSETRKEAKGVMGRVNTITKTTHAKRCPDLRKNKYIK